MQPTPISTRGSSPTTGGPSGSTTAAASVGLIAFDVPSGRFGLDVRLVREVVTIERVLPVPLAPPGVLGLFNLRGHPVALLDLLILLDMPRPARPVGQRERDPIALVLLVGSTVVGAVQVDAVLGVIPPGASELNTSDRRGEHPAVLGLISTPGHGAVAVLDGAALHQRLPKLRHR